ncbi:hypothetical protein B0H14DRAFT_3142180 [Mycena olivaceomarginata]|nr:hypothetical protein B0H14DRAFT_3142180 [Mycena olivaceomarginata]
MTRNTAEIRNGVRVTPNLRQPIPGGTRAVPWIAVWGGLRVDRFESGDGAGESHLWEVGQGRILCLRESFSVPNSTGSTDDESDKRRLGENDDRRRRRKGGSKRHQGLVDCLSSESPVADEDEVGEVTMLTERQNRRVLRLQRQDETITAPAARQELLIIFGALIGLLAATKIVQDEGLGKEESGQGSAPHVIHPRVVQSSNTNKERLGNTRNHFRHIEFDDVNIYQINPY